MKTNSILIVAAVIAVATGTVVSADHNNPWATAGDIVLSKNHDSNQLKSLDTPGEDEMRGNMNQNGASKTGGNRGSGGSGSKGDSSKGGSSKGGGKSGGKGGERNR
jgi:uncharacterized membrane protein YgcG